MWVFFENGTFYSAVTDKTDEDGIWVRSRDRRSSDILAEWVSETFRDGEEVRVQEWKARDYDFRVQLVREEWAQYCEYMALKARGTNFKSAVGRELGHRHPFVNALHDVWQVMFDYQWKNKREEPADLVELEDVQGLEDDNEWAQYDAWWAEQQQLKATNKGRKLGF